MQSEHTCSDLFKITKHFTYQLRPLIIAISNSSMHMISFEAELGLAEKIPYLNLTVHDKRAYNVNMWVYTAELSTGAYSSAKADIWRA